ncbi:MAG: hypothetical protein FJ035_08780 [Chloroflexi bacterium]|nr:hypothetical protein [Chloroflexota bacterium]
MDAPTHATLPKPGATDATAIAALDGVLAVHPNQSHWWNHGAFALPLLGGLASTGIGAVGGFAEALGFGLFLLACAACMLPVALLGWRSTATSIVLTREQALALHKGRVLRRIAWPAVARIERFDTMGNVRWKLLPTGGGEHLTIEGEIADVPGLIERARALAPHASGGAPAERA